GRAADRQPAGRTRAGASRRLPPGRHRRGRPGDGRQDDQAGRRAGGAAGLHRPRPLRRLLGPPPALAALRQPSARRHPRGEAVRRQAARRGRARGAPAGRPAGGGRM
ncbi:MAG: hypothetical protein AVDCRST_MAG32-237, partial [uncultured Nocardioides sp.]